MKINKLQSLLIAAVAFAGASCSEDNNLNMIPDSLYLNNAGVNTVTVYDGTGINATTEVVVVKAGKGFVGANVTLKIDETLLTGKYSEGDYITLPSDCYSFDRTTLEFAKDDYLKSIYISWNYAKLSEYLEEALEDDFEYVIPLQLVNNTASTIELKSERSDMILIPVLEDGIVKFTSEINASGIFVGEMPVVGKLADYVAYFPVETNFLPAEGFKYTIEIDESYVAEYNQLHGTNYNVLPSDFYTFKSMEWDFPAQQKIGYCIMTLHEKKLQPSEEEFLFGSYMLPIRLKSATQGKIDKSSALIPYVMEFNPIEIDRANWTVEACNCVGKDDPSGLTASQLTNDLPEMMLDGKTSTYWSSVWSTQGLAMYPLPYVIDFYMDGTYRLIRLAIENPTGSADKEKRGTFKKGHFEYSLDGKVWEPLGESFESEEGALSVTVDVPITKASYIRLVIEDVYDRYGGFYGRCSIAEIRAWRV